MVGKLSRGFVFQGFINRSVISIIPGGVFIKYIFIIPVGIPEIEIQPGIFPCHFCKPALQTCIGKEATASISVIADFVGRSPAATIKETLGFQAADPQVETELTKGQQFSGITQIMPYKSAKPDIKTVGFIALVSSSVLFVRYLATVRIQVQRAANRCFF